MYQRAVFAWDRIRENVQGEARRTASTQKQSCQHCTGCAQSCPSVVDGYGGTKMYSVAKWRMKSYPRR